MTTDLERILFAELLKQTGCDTNVDTERLRNILSRLSNDEVEEMTDNEIIWFEINDYTDNTIELNRNGETIFKYKTNNEQECMNLKKELQKLMPYIK